MSIIGSFTLHDDWPIIPFFIRQLTADINELNLEQLPCQT
jgi:hypothetical protein